MTAIYPVRVPTVPVKNQEIKGARSQNSCANSYLRSNDRPRAKILQLLKHIPHDARTMQCAENVKPYTWNMYGFMNGCHPNKFNKNKNNITYAPVNILISWVNLGWLVKQCYIIPSSRFINIRTHNRLDIIFLFFFLLYLKCTWIP